MIARGALLLLAAMLAAHGSAEAQVRQLGLREMVASAGAIFVGTVGTVRGGYDESGDVVTYTTFTVEDPIYGVSTRSLTIKQLGGEAGGLTTRLEHMRYFRGGERVLVMLYPTSKLGFTSPIGLDQAAWTVTTGGMVSGVRSESVSDVLTMMKRYGAMMQGDGSVVRAAFVAVIGQLLEEVGKR